MGLCVRVLRRVCSREVERDRRGEHACVIKHTAAHMEGVAVDSTEWEERI